MLFETASALQNKLCWSSSSALPTASCKKRKLARHNLHKRGLFASAPEMGFGQHLVHIGQGMFEMQRRKDPDLACFWREGNRGKGSL